MRCFCGLFSVSRIFYQHLFILPHYLLGIAWLLGSAAVMFPWLWWKKFDRELLFAFFQFQGHVVYTLLRPVVRGIAVINKNSTADGNTARLYTANHQSIMDSFVFSQLDARRVAYVAKNWPFRVPFYGRYLRAIGSINTDEIDFTRLCAQVQRNLIEGVSVVFFPEGTRCKTPGRFHSMAFHVAAAVGADVTPVAISGHAEMLPPKGRLPRPAMLRYTILPTVSIKNFPGETGPLAMARQVRKLITTELAAE